MIKEKTRVKWGLGIGDWGLGIGDWAQSPIPTSVFSLIIKYYITIYIIIYLILTISFLTL